MTIVLLISRKFWRWALASSCAFPLNGVACTMLMRLGLSSNSRLLVLSVGPVRMFLVLRAENSRRVFSVIASETGVELPLDWFDCDWWNLLVNHNQSYNTLYKIWTKTKKGKPAKAGVLRYDFTNKYLFDQFSFSLVPLPGNGARNACWHFLESLFTKLSSLVMMPKIGCW